MADEEIIIKYVVEADKAVEDAERMREVIEASKEAIRRTVAEGKIGFKDLGKSMIESFKSMTVEDKVKLGDFLKIDPETLNRQSEFVRARQEAISLIRTAVTELGQEERKQAIQSAQVVRAAKQQEAAAQREYEKITKQGYGVMSDAAKAYGQQVAQVKQQIVTQAQTSGQTYTQVAQQMQQAGTSANVLNSALKQLNQESTKNQSSIKNLGQAIQYAFVTILGLNAVNAIRSAISSLQDFMEKGNEVSQSFFLLEAGVRALRRAGVDVTSKELLDNLQRLNEETGKFYTQLELVKGVAAFSNLIRDMGFTKDQIFELQQAIITLAVVNGRSMDEVQRTVALALSSGYTEGLQRLGLSINRVNIAARANQMGFEGGYTALTEHQRALATLSLIMEKTANYSNDLTEAQNRLFGSIQRTKTEIEDTKNTIGEQLLPIWLAILKVVEGFIAVLARIPFIAVIRGITSLYQIIKAIPAVWDKASESTDNFFKKVQTVAAFVIRAGEAVAQMKPLSEVFSDWGNFGQEEIPLGTPAPDLEGLDPTAIEESGKEIKDYVSELYADIEKETRRFNSRMAELERDLGRDLAKIERELGRDLAEATREYQRDREKIIEDGERKVQKAIEDYNRKVIEEQRKYANKVAEAESKYREDQLQAEIDYQEDLRKLREGFLFDLEDALRERDARQVLNLIRRYNLEKDQTGRQFEIENEERARQHALQMEEMAREYAERMQLMAEEQAARIAQIREDTRLELEERRMAYEQEKADRIQKAADDIEERKIRQQELIAELKIESEERLAEIIAALAEEANMTSAMLENIGNEYRRIYGPNGVIDRQLQYYIARLAQLSQLKARAMATSSSGYDISDYADKTYYGNGGSFPIPNAEGGIMYADRPTTVTFGEAGLEKAEFTPINYRGMNTGKVTHSLVSSNGANGKIAIALDLSPDLEARITENTLDQAAEVMFEVQRKR